LHWLNPHEHAYPRGNEAPITSFPHHHALQPDMIWSKSESKAAGAAFEDYAGASER
jgi:hypothetical protein